MLLEVHGVEASVLEEEYHLSFAQTNGDLLGGQ